MEQTLEAALMEKFGLTEEQAAEVAEHFREHRREVESTVTPIRAEPTPEPS